MKKIAGLLIAAFMGICAVSAQNLKLEANGEVVTEGATITVEGVSDGWEGITCYMKITNSSAKNIEVRLEFSRDGLAEGATAMICGFGQCSTLPFIEGVVGANSVAGEGDTPIDIAYTPVASEVFIAPCKLINKTDNATLNFNIRFVPQNAANDNLELAGVSVYPNPSHGMFNLNVPERAQVEIFAVNGQMIRQMEVMAGKTAVEINRAGVYFLRVRAGGKTAVKRVVIG